MGVVDVDGRPAPYIPPALQDAYDRGDLPPDSAGYAVLVQLYGQLGRTPPPPTGAVLLPPRGEVGIPGVPFPPAPSVPEPEPGPSPIPPVSPAPTPPGREGREPAAAPPGGGGGFRIPDLNPFNGLTEAVRGAVGAVVGPVFAALTAVVDRLVSVARGLAEATIPTISELALGIARTSLSALTFIADNLTDTLDLGQQLAIALTTPVAVLIEDAGARVASWILVLLRALATALQAVSAAAIAPAERMERLL